MVPWGYLYFIRRAFLAFVVATAGYAGQAEFICKRLAARLDPAFAKHAQQLLVDAEANLRKQENGVEGGRLPRDGWEARRIGLLELYRQLHNLAQVHEANEKVMREDPAYEEMAKGENAEIERTVRKLSGDIKKQVLETLDPGPGANAPLIIEVNADGKGYDAGMFVKYLTQTYAATAKANGLKIDVVSTQLGETQASGTGYTSATLMVSGKDAYRIFRSEAGVHVMKSPPLDGKKDNRIFTTPIRVTVVPEISTKSAESIPESEFEI